MIEQQQYDDSKPKEGEEFIYEGRKYVLVDDIVHEVLAKTTQIAELLPSSGSHKSSKDKVKISIEYKGSVAGARGILSSAHTISSDQPSQPTTHQSFVHEDNDIRVISLSDLSSSPAVQPPPEEISAPAALIPPPAELGFKNAIHTETHIRYRDKSHKGLVIGSYVLTACIVGGIAFSANGAAGGNACAAHGLPDLNVVTVVGCVTTGYLGHFGINLSSDGK